MKPFFIGSILALAALFTTACDHSTTPPRAVLPTEPSPSLNPAPAGQSATVAGSVWLHDTGGVKPYANIDVWGWLQLERSGQRVGPVRSGPDGRYSFAVPTGASLRVQVGAAYQPCVATVAVTGNTNRDVHIIVDQAQLGAHLPSELLDDTPTLSGMVFETTALGRQPVPDVRVELDMLGGLGDVSATTLTDSDGRYVLCGLRGVESTYVWATKSGYYKGAEVGTVHLNGNTIRDIELGR